MPGYFVNSYFIQIEEKYRLIREMKSKTKKEANFYEYERLLASYYVIEICSGFEAAVKDLVKEVLKSNPSSNSLKSYLLSTHYISSAECDKLSDFLKKINDGSHTIFKARLTDRQKDAIRSLYYNRQRIVHYGESKTAPVTLKDVEEWRMNAAWVIRKFETVLNSSL